MNETMNLSAPETEPGIFAELRAACAEVTRRASWVRIDNVKLDRLAQQLCARRARPDFKAPAPTKLRSDKLTLAYVLTMNAINFGSGWFPHLHKPDGRSGYLTLSSALHRHFQEHGAWRADQLEALGPEELARIFGQELAPPVDELMGHYAAALNELGAFLRREHGGRFEGPIQAAEGSAERLVSVFAQLPHYQDVSLYQGFEVPFYKRVQILAFDLADALSGRGAGRFGDLDRLTLFADNLVPHVLRVLGVLVYDLKLQSAIRAERLLPHGSEQEVEIRAVALHAVELLADSCARRGFQALPSRLDMLLWWRGQQRKFKAQARHRTRCTFY